MAVNSTMMPLGTQAPDFGLPDPSGRVWTLAGFAAAPGLLVMFICNHCPYVQHIAPTLATTTAEWQRRGIAVVGVQSNDWDAYPDDSPTRMAEVAAASGYSFPYVVDEDQQTARAFGAACTPDFFLFDGDRRLVYRGRFDASRPGTDTPVTGEDLGAAVDSVLDGTPMPPDQLPSIGCGIKWRLGNEPAS